MIASHCASTSVVASISAIFICAARCLFYLGILQTPVLICAALPYAFIFAIIVITWSILRNTSLRLGISYIFICAALLPSYSLFIFCRHHRHLPRASYLHLRSSSYVLVVFIFAIVIDIITGILQIPSPRLVSLSYLHLYFWLLLSYSLSSSLPSSSSLRASFAIFIFMVTALFQIRPLLVSLWWVT
jgi:hypothetical protein